jgi:hypothetical protein
MCQDGCASNGLAGKMGAGPLIMRTEVRTPGSQKAKRRGAPHLRGRGLSGRQPCSHGVVARNSAAEFFPGSVRPAERKNDKLRLTGPASGGSGKSRGDKMEYEMSEEPSSIPKNPRTHHRVDWGRQIVIAQVSFDKRKRGERGSVAQHTHEKGEESWATAACSSARRVHGVLCGREAITRHIRY